MKDIYWKNDKLRSNSIIYRRKADIYESFSKAEDFSDKIFQFLEPIVKGKIILDLGCGTGKFIPKIAPLVAKYFALDVSPQQIKIAQRKAKNLKNIQFIHASAEKTGVGTGSVDIVIAAWFLGSVHNLDVRERIVKEACRVLKKDGSFYVIENNNGGDYKNIIESPYGDEKTKLKLKWLEETGFRKMVSFETYFEFKSLEFAKKIFSLIWNDEISSKIKRRKIFHNIVIHKLEDKFTLKRRVAWKK